MNVLCNYFIISFTTNLLAVSAPPFPFQLEQSNGKIIPVNMYGNEHYNWVETVDGYVIEWAEKDSSRFEFEICL